MRKCPECGKMSLNFDYECGVAIAWCTNCEYVKTSWPYYEQAIKKLREAHKQKTGCSPLLNFL